MNQLGWEIRVVWQRVNTKKGTNLKVHTLSIRPFKTQFSIIKTSRFIVKK